MERIDGYAPIRDYALVGTIVLTSTLRLAQELGWTRMDIPLLLGSAFTDRRSIAVMLGYGLHFANGVVISLGYYGVFRPVGHAGWRFGAALGIVHAALRAPDCALDAGRPRRLRRDRGRVRGRLLAVSGSRSPARSGGGA